jgi:hypothetical protein
VVRRMDFDAGMVIDYIIPDSSSDFGTILLWILIILLVIIAIIDIHLYLDNQRASKKLEWIPMTEEPQQKPDTIDQMKKSKNERIQEIVDIRNKVDKIIEINKL